MPRYLGLYTYTAEGTKGFLKDKAAGREAAARKAIEGIGGKLELMYWPASGEYSAISIFEIPDAATGVAAGAMLMSSGAFSEVKSIELLTASEIDRALGKSMTYRPPGG